MHSTPLHVSSSVPVNGQCGAGSSRAVPAIPLLCSLKEGEWHRCGQVELRAPALHVPSVSLGNSTELGAFQAVSLGLQDAGGALCGGAALCAIATAPSLLPGMHRAGLPWLSSRQGVQNMHTAIPEMFTLFDADVFGLECLCCFTHCSFLLHTVTIPQVLACSTDGGAVCF